jgi:hypothetical protein
MKISLLLIIIFFCGCEKIITPPGHLVVEGYLYANRPLDSIRIVETVPSDIPFNTVPVINADVVLKIGERQFKLIEFQNRPGVYHDEGNDCLILPNTNYKLTVRYKNYVLTAQTYILSDSAKPYLSKDTIVVTKIMSSLNYNKSYSLLSWYKQTDYSFIVENYEKTGSSPVEIQPLSATKYVPYYLQRPFDGNFISMQTYDFKYYGTYNICILQVHEDFKKLFDEPRNTQLPYPPQENITGGFGIFTGIYCDTVRLTVVKE